MSVRKKTPESIRCLWGIFLESDSIQIWRANLKSSPNLESWFGQLSKLRPVVISNKFLRVGLMGVCPILKGVSQESIRSLSEVCRESDGNQNWRADFDRSPNWNLVSCQKKFRMCLMWVTQESVRVCQESVRSMSGVCQESVRSLIETKFGEMIWIVFQILTFCYLQ